MIVPLHCPACNREANGRDECGQCGTDLTLLHLLASLPPVTGTVAAPSGHKGWIVPLTAICLGLGVGRLWPTAPPASLAVRPVPSPSTAAPTVSAAVPTGFPYTVRAGDSLWRLAYRFYGDGERWSRLAAANPALRPDALTVGQAVIIPFPEERRP